ncbi:hypothetical protein HNR25_001336 [Streptomonospora salina]|uniref:Uncharacterized protein n=1 Tax=Streptomonospora salina TaxID=104205 RepID=A0A841E356_9ACTN|nr:hypothetical protein [Streptomonospora salina]
MTPEARRGARIRPVTVVPSPAGAEPGRGS